MPAGAGGAAAGSGSAPRAGAPAPAVMPELSDTRTLIPDVMWSCGMAEGIPGPATGTELFEINFTVSEIHDIGQTQYGRRRQIDVSGGEIAGTKLTATLRERGLDYEVTLDNGVVEVEQLNILQAGGTTVFMRNCGVSPSSAVPVRMVVDFEAPTSSSVAWLNTGKYIGTRRFDAQTKKLSMKVYEVTAAPDPSNAVRVPPLVGPHQSWECAKASGTKGPELFTETVGVGGSIAVGKTKRGTRNIIPITGGTVTGKVTGSVLSGGADYQLSAGSGFVLDARYTLKGDDGEYVIVRNCGAGGALVPVFEAKKDGPYGWITQGQYLSSDPGVAAGAVKITIYERR